MNIYEKLEAIQQEYKAPKSEYNSHGGFKYRTLEKMQQNFKPLAKKHRVVLLFTDRAIDVSNRPHIEATAMLVDLDDVGSKVVVTALAQEAEIQKGMQMAQISGSTSSYARKYALQGLLQVDDTDETDVKEGDQTDWNEEINRSKSVNELMKVYGKMDTETKQLYVDALATRKKEIIEDTTNAGTDNSPTA